MVSYAKLCLLGASVLVVIAGRVDAATSQPDLRAMNFARAADLVTTSRFVQAGFAMESRLNSGAFEAFIIRNPGPGLLNAGGLNTVPYNGTQYLTAFTSAIVSLRNLASQPFVLKSLDVAEYSAVPDLTTMLRVTGTKVGGTTVVATYNINRKVNGQTGDFRTLTFDQSWSSLESLTIVASDSNFRFYNGFSMDNVILEVVPEPSTGILSASMVGLLAARRRRRKSDI